MDSVVLLGFLPICPVKPVSYQTLQLTRIENRPSPTRAMHKDRNPLSKCNCLHGSSHENRPDGRNSLLSSGTNLPSGPEPTTIHQWTKFSSMQPLPEGSRIKVPSDTTTMIGDVLDLIYPYHPFVSHALCSFEVYPQRGNLTCLRLIR